MLKIFLSRLREKFSLKNIKEFKLKKHTKLFSVLAVLIVVGLALPKGLVYAGWEDAILGHTLFPIIYVIFSVLLMIAWVIVGIAAYTLNAVLNPAIMNQVFSNPGIYQGWTIIRDICNLLFLLLMLLVAFGTIVQSDRYNIKKSLPKLILAIFLINFSNVIAGVIIDFGNILMYGILSWMCAIPESCFTDFTGGLMRIAGNFVNEYNVLNVGSYFSFSGVTAQMAIGAGIALVYTFIYAFILLALALFLIVRTAGLAILLILAPLAYFGEVMPGMENLSKKWWDNIWSYTLFGPIFALMLYISGELARIRIVVPPISAGDPNLGWFSDIIIIIIQNAIPLVFLLAIIPITKSLGLAGTDTIMKNTTGLGERIGKGAMSYAGGATDRWLARGAQDQRSGWKGKFNRARAYLSPGAIKRGWKAKTSEQEHDYDVAVGQMRDIRAPKRLGGKETHYKDIANRNDVARRIKDFATTNGDEIVDMFQGATNITDKQVLLRMGAVEGKSYAMAATQTDKSTGNKYTADAAGYNKFVHDHIIPHMNSEEAAKLFEDIGDLEKKKGNMGLADLGHYDKGSKKWDTYNYSAPDITKNGITKTQEEWHREDIVKSVRRSNALSSMKELRASTFINENGDWNETGAALAPSLQTVEAKSHIKKLKPEEAEQMKIGLLKKETRLAALVPPQHLSAAEAGLYADIVHFFP
ncbi:MAG: hypothetical protein Q8N37_02615 [bacterium]|nr:hypothetical protein [bacterium]